MIPNIGPNALGRPQNWFPEIDRGCRRLARLSCRLTEVFPDSPALKAGLASGLVIQKIDGVAALYVGQPQNL